MKKSILTTFVVAGLILSGITSALAMEKTLTGIASCGKNHETLLTVQDGANTVIYHLVQNDTSKQFHGTICHKAAKVTATGDATEVGGQWQLTATKIELAAK